MKRFLPLLLPLLLLTGCAEDRAIRLATTTSIDNSGLLDLLLTEYEKETGLKVDALAVGSGKAMRLVRRGDADLMITHDTQGERGFIDVESPLLYRKMMCSDFLIAGPAEDPAGLSETDDVSEAMARIASSGSRFASRGDRSGTHVREIELWKIAGANRPAPDNYLETGQGMAATLRVASERAAYVLTDRATFMQLRDSLKLVPLFTNGGPMLLNCYAVTVPTGPGEESALRLADWLTRGYGRSLIESFEIAGETMFESWPEGVRDDQPESRF